jgi:hypothetical protein
MTPWCKSLRSCKWPPTVSSQCGDLDFQGGDLLARSLGSDPPLLAAPGQVGRAVLVAFDGGLEVFELALAPISAHCGRSGSKRRAGRVVLASLSRRRFHGGFPAYLLLLIDWWGPLSHRPSATKPITSHEAVWPSQGQPCSVPALPSHAANLLSFLTRRTQTSLARLATRTRSARCASRAATSSFRAESRATGRNWIWSPGESWPTRSRSAEMMCAT